MTAASPRNPILSSPRLRGGTSCARCTGRLPEQRRRQGLGRPRPARVRPEPHSPAKRAAPRSRRQSARRTRRPTRYSNGRSARPATEAASDTRTTRRASRELTFPAPTPPRRRWRAGPETATSSRSIRRTTACRSSRPAESSRSRAMPGWRWMACCANWRSSACGKKTVRWLARTGSTSFAQSVTNANGTKRAYQGRGDTANDAVKQVLDQVTLDRR